MGSNEGTKATFRKAAPQKKASTKKIRTQRGQIAVGGVQRNGIAQRTAKETAERGGALVGREVCSWKGAQKKDFGEGGWKACCVQVEEETIKVTRILRMERWLHSSNLFSGMRESSQCLECF